MFLLLLRLSGNDYSPEWNWQSALSPLSPLFYCLYLLPSVSPSLFTPPPSCLLFYLSVLFQFSLLLLFYCLSLLPSVQFVAPEHHCCSLTSSGSDRSTITCEEEEEQLGIKPLISVNYYDVYSYLTIFLQKDVANKLEKNVRFHIFTL